MMGRFTDKMRKIFFFSALLLFSFSVFSEEQDFPDDIEGFGPTRVNGTVGNGALSIGISQWGEITVLRYPSPSFWDQLDYRTREGEKSRKLKYFGALENQGGFILLYDKQNIISLRETEKIKQFYKNEDSGVLITQYEVDDETKVYVYDFVYPYSDIFIRKISVDTKSSSDIYVIHYLNLAPTTIKTPRVPVEDWQDDTRNDFAAFVTGNFAVQFIPFFRNRNSLKSEYERIKNFSYDELLDYARKITGIFLAFGFSGESWSYVGFDRRCGDGRSQPAFQNESAFDMIKNKKIEGSFEKSFALCSADGFSAIKACQDGKCTNVFFVISAGKTFDEAITKVKTMTDYAKMEKETDDFWKDKTSKIESRFPYLNQHERELCKRALISMLQATDRETKATVASISTQPPYAEDWPRDGAYFNLFLDLAGFHELAQERNLFYEKVQSKEPEGDIPAGTWRMNFYADGMVGGPWDFEIDQVGFVLWSWANHIKFIENKIDFLKKIYEAVKLSAENVLINCKSENGLQCLAHEDDNITPSITMVGSAMVYTGIKSAMTIAEIMKDYELYSKLKQRKEELEEAIFENYTEEGKGFVFPATNAPPGMPYVLFPADIPMNDDQIENYGRSTIAVLYYNFFERRTLIYEGKWILSLIVAAEKLKDTRPSVSQEFMKEAEKFLKILVEEVPTSTKHIGEFVRVFKDGDKFRYENRIAIPHIWQATLTCLTAIAFRSPETLNYMLPASFEEERKATGCQCKTFSIYDSAFVLLMVVFYILVRRTRMTF